LGEIGGRELAEGQDGAGLKREGGKREWRVDGGRHEWRAWEEGTYGWENSNDGNRMANRTLRELQMNS